MRSIIRIIDSASDLTGRAIKWLVPGLVLVVSLDVVMRYVFNAPTLWGVETAMMMCGSLFALAACYALRHRTNVRIDLIYGRLRPRWKALIDVAGDLLLFFPLIILFAVVSTESAFSAWQSGEKSIVASWEPPLAPFRTVIAVAFILLALQGLAQFVRDVYLLTRNKAYD